MFCGVIFLSGEWNLSCVVPGGDFLNCQEDPEVTTWQEAFR